MKKFLSKYKKSKCLIFFAIFCAVVFIASTISWLYLYFSGEDGDRNGIFIALVAVSGLTLGFAVSSYGFYTLRYLQLHVIYKIYIEKNQKAISKYEKNPKWKKVISKWNEEIKNQNISFETWIENFEYYNIANYK